MIDLSNWLLNRGIPATRQGLKEELKSLGVHSTFELMLNNLGLFLSDHYWIKETSSDYTWDSINLYENDFKSMNSLDLDKCDLDRLYPSSSVHGDLKKKWMVGKNGADLWKYNYKG